MAGSGRHNADLTLAVALASGLTQEQAARQAGVSERTVTRRLADPAFRQQVAEARAETVSRTAARLTAGGLAATTALLRLLSAESESVRLGAARAILDLGTKMREAGELEERLARLEERLNGATDRRNRWEASASA